VLTLFLILIFSYSISANEIIPVKRNIDEIVTLSVNGNIKASKEVSIQVPRGVWDARIMKMPEDGAIVKSGEVILLLKSEYLEERIVDMEKSLNQTLINDKRNEFQQEIGLFNLKNNVGNNKNSLEIEQLNHDLVIKGTDKRLLKIKRLEIESLKHRITFLKEQIKKEGKLLKKGFLSKIQLESERVQLLNMQIDLELKKIDYDYDLNRPGRFELLKADYSKENAESNLLVSKREYEFELKSLESSKRNRQYSLKRLKNQLKRLNDTLDSCKIKAQVSGIYIRPKSGWSDVSIGSRAWSGMGLGKIIDSSKKIVTAKIFERNIENIKTGLKVDFSADSNKNEDITGIITHISSLAMPLFPGVKAYDIKITPNGELPFLTNQSVKIKIHIADLKNVFKFPSSFVYMEKEKEYVLLNSGKELLLNPKNIVLRTFNYIYYKDSSLSDTLKLSIKDTM